MTELLYLRDSYARDFEAEVIFIDGLNVELDRTIFYPEGGGQPTDKGTLEADSETWIVKEVRKRAGKILHKLDKEVPPVGTRITGHLNWDRRYSIMRYHTALHVLAKVLYDEFGAEVSGNQIYANRARLDFAIDSLTPEHVSVTLDKAHQIIETSRPVKIFFISREKAETVLDPTKTRLDLIPKSVKELRIVEIEGLDTDACAGTHVKNTSEIGQITVTKTLSKGKLNRRMELTLSPPTQ